MKGTIRRTQRHQPNHPPHKNVNSAGLHLLPTGHFSGKSAKTAKDLLFLHFVLG
jgi:hypothetical protein